MKHLKPALLLEILLHVLFWTFITFLPFISGPPPGHLPFWHLLLFNILLAIQFYLNALVLIPFILRDRKRPLLYFILMALAMTIAIVTISWIQPNPVFFANIPHSQPERPPHSPLLFLPFIAITAGSFVYRYLTDHFRQARQRHDIDNAALLSELSFLRTQISPHFIFNVINSIVALSRLRPEAVEPALIRLSRLLRYMLYISDDEKVSMGQKAEYLGSYIELQKLRFGTNTSIEYQVHIGCPEKTLEPMLLIPFVENAFKHGIVDAQRPAIQISLVADKKMLDFRVYNQRNATDQTLDTHHGIGLQNVKRRLELLYPGKHRLLIAPTTHTYYIHLQLYFHQ